VEVFNGQKALLANTVKLASFDVTGVDELNLACKDAGGNTVAVAGATNIQPALDASTGKVTCTFDVEVTDAHAAAGEIPAFTVAAALSAAIPDISLTMETLNIVAVPVSTGSTLAASPAVPRSGTFLQGKALSCCIQSRPGYTAQPVVLPHAAAVSRKVAARVL
jgi:hypothetical protein